MAGRVLDRLSVRPLLSEFRSEAVLGDQATSVPCINPDGFSRSFLQ